MLGGTRLQQIHRGGGHTPGDTMVWLPDSKVVFADDIVYVDRLLAVIPVSHSGRWLEAFAAIEALAPRVIVPAHGHASDLATARQQTRDFRVAKRAHAHRAVEQSSSRAGAGPEHGGERI
ncbi:MBL fold metallo-hydrolase [Hydrogenophaga borbori]